MKYFNKTVILIALLFLSFFSCGITKAARTVPEEVEPLIYNGVKYIAPHTKMGYTEAWDIKTGDKLWEKKVYDVKINPFIEEDVQWVFITDLKIEDGKLVVVNEAGKIYRLDPKNGDVFDVSNISDNSSMLIPVISGVFIFILGIFLFYRLARKRK